MPVYQLPDDIVFPDPRMAREDGLLAVGGDLAVQRLLLAYEHGIFPWYSGGEEILWWSPNPRFVLYPTEIKVSKSMKQVLRSKRFDVTVDRAFADVMGACRNVPRKDEEAGSSWINDDMTTAYNELHKLGLAHSVETWRDGELVGGLYGVSLGKCFFGESMFARESNASKIALILLARRLLKLDFHVIDCQVPTDHLASLGARAIDGERFYNELRQAVLEPTMQGSWAELAAFQYLYD